ncbi:unnamed protein product [Cylindrotheca closterium]|uniref:PARP-type domain-containing protein n=1 Tax=Cylindrotheca closterium TaxID=2856 RepID=A0AAD2CN73_9STRA|nr:unnamed protein product [Cylindrotheca closterium]
MIHCLIYFVVHLSLSIMPEYLINRAPSGRATCQGSKEKIAKGDIRMSVSNDTGDMVITKHWKLDYFKMPRKFANMDVDDFVENEVTIKEEDEIELDEVLRLLRAAPDNLKNKKASPKKGGDGDDQPTLMDKIKAAAETSQDEPMAKKVKTELPADFDQLVEEYKKLIADKPKVEALKDYLRWNKQVIKGNKDFVIFKVIDGKVHGRLGYCALDGGRLKMEEDCVTVVSMGTFDETLSMPIPSDFKAPRLDPKLQRLKWFNQKPSEEEEEEMDKLYEDAKAMGQGGAAGASGASGEGGELRQELLDAAENIENWSLAKADKKTLKGYQVAIKAIGEGKIAFPEGNRVNNEIGQLLVQNKKADASAKEVMGLVIDKFGLVEVKEKNEAAKAETIATSCACPENGKMVAAFEELAGLYFKEGNRNAGSTYKRVSSALKDLEVEVTAKNATSFSKGKTKIQGIGPSSAKKMLEFAETGTMEKLEEKRKLS